MQDTSSLDCVISPPLAELLEGLSLQGLLGSLILHKPASFVDNREHMLLWIMGNTTWQPAEFPACCGTGIGGSEWEAGPK